MIRHDSSLRATLSTQLRLLQGAWPMQAVQSVQDVQGQSGRHHECMKAYTRCLTQVAEASLDLLGIMFSPINASTINGH